MRQMEMLGEENKRVMHSINYSMLKRGTHMHIVQLEPL